MKKTDIGIYFILAGLLALLTGIFFGLAASFQYIVPEFLLKTFPFYKVRPLHVSLVIAWIFLGSVGGVYYYLPKILNRKLFSDTLAKIHFAFFVFTGMAIIICYIFGIFGGREYFEHPQILAVPVLFSWILLIVNFFKTTGFKFKNYPVYLWMWATGIGFFLITLIEANLWAFPFFRDNIVRDITVQWKALGSMVGSWNMLVYGTAFYLMEKIKGDEKTANSRLVFFFYFLSMANMMFNWGHHTYIVPASKWIKYTAYFISMTELLILGNIIRNWKNTLTDAQRHFHILPFRFLVAADVWVFLNLSLALTISNPAINFYTHGTHITVAHAMGTTIGINTTILLASIFYIFSQNAEFSQYKKIIKSGFWIFNVSLFVFWFALIGAGISKGMTDNYPFQINNFQELMLKLKPFFNVLAVSGAGIFIAILMIIYPVLKVFFSKRLN